MLSEIVKKEAKTYLIDYYAVPMALLSYVT